MADEKEINPRAKLLFEAENIVNGDRNVQYGDPNQDFKRTANLWSTFLGVRIEPWQVTAMMILLKISRISWSPNNYDSWLDVAGYAACGWDVISSVTIDPEKEEVKIALVCQSCGGVTEPYSIENLLKTNVCPLCGKKMTR